MHKKGPTVHADNIPGSKLVPKLYRYSIIADEFNVKVRDPS